MQQMMNQQKTVSFKIAYNYINITSLENEFHHLKVRGETFISIVSLFVEFDYRELQ